MSDTQQRANERIYFVGVHRRLGWWQKAHFLPTNLMPESQEMENSDNNGENTCCKHSLNQEWKEFKKYGRWEICRIMCISAMLSSDCLWTPSPSFQFTFYIFFSTSLIARFCCWRAVEYEQYTSCSPSYSFHSSSVVEWREAAIKLEATSLSPGNL